MTLPTIRLGLVARLAVLLGGLAAISTVLALFIQDRALNADLHSAAQSRLHGAAVAAERLTADHLRSVAYRYSAISRTPEFRANLDAGHRPTLSFYAKQLAKDQGAAAVVFTLASGETVVSAGPALLSEAAAQRVARDSRNETVACVGAGQTAVADSTATGTLTRCGFPDRTEASMLEQDGRVYVRVAVPLRTRGAVVGGLIALEALHDETFAAWSNMLGARMHVAGAASSSDTELTEHVSSFPDLDLVLATTYASERHAIAHSRRSLLLSGLGALVLALVASLFLARRFSQPILEINSAAQRVREGVLDPALDVGRNDELGDLGRAFNTVVSRLRGSEWQLGRARRIAQLDHWSFDCTTQQVEGGAEFRRLFGHVPEGPISIDDFVARVRADDRDKLLTAMRRLDRPGGSIRLQVRVPLRPGRERVLHLRGTSESGQLTATVQDVTQRWATSRRIRYLSLHDRLTGLGNREYFLRHVERAVQHGERFAVLMVGVNEFHMLTSAVGHAAADDALRSVAQRIIDALPSAPLEPSTDDEQDAGAMRVGNAEFATVMRVENRTEAMRLAERLLKQLDCPMVVGSEELTVEASIGICLWPDDAGDVERLVRNALTALEQSKILGHARYQFYQGAMHEEASRRLRMASQLRRAIEHGELEVHYQPRVRPKDGKVLGVEALARWTSDEFGIVPPSEFIPVAEEAGLVGQLGQWCLGVAIQELATLQTMGVGDLRMAVNVSKHQLTPRIVGDLVATARGTDPTSLEFEVTESALINRDGEALQALETLGNQGFRISLDDFGTGYSSLGYLRQLPIDAVKIDRSFISELATNDEAASIIWAVVMMCEALRLDAVAEGVETKMQRERVIELGCHEAQGFLFAPPMSATALQQFLSTQHKIHRTSTTV